MGWASSYIADLKAGKTVSFRPRGNSMTPRIESGQLCTVEPLNTRARALEKGDVVLCKVRGAEYLHFVSAVAQGGLEVQISNARGHVNGWTSRGNVFGVLVRVEP